MASTPLFDMSKAQPIQANAAPLFDMSKAQSTGGPQPITDNTAMSAPISPVRRIGRQLKAVGSAAVNSNFPYVHPLDALSSAGDQASATIQRYAPSAVTELLLGGQAAGKPMGTREGLLNNPITPMLAGAIEMPRAVETATSPEVTGPISGAYNSAKNAVGGFLRDPETGKLKPLTREVARAIGAATGYEAGKDTGHGMEGMLLGGVAGPGIADALIPASESAAMRAAAMAKGPSIPIQNSPYFDPEAYKAGRAGIPPTDPYAPPSTVAMSKPLRPLVGTPEDWQTYDQQMSILRPEASDAGVYHAARGSATRNVNLQQRIGNRITR